MPNLSRRQFLAGATATAAAIAAPGLASAADPPDWAPDHIRAVGDDEAELRKYEPYLDIAWDDQEQLIGTYGWYMDSEEYDTRAYYYWLKYAKQDSWADRIPILGPVFSADSHFKDHEPIAQFVDMDSGEVQETMWSGWHHVAVALAASDMTYVQDEASFPTHPSLEVESPHHHYSHQLDSSLGVPAHTISGTEFGSFLEKQPLWEQNGVFDSSHTPSVRDPWAARSRGTWWPEDSFDYQLRRAQLVLGWYNGDGEVLI